MTNDTELKGSLLGRGLSLAAEEPVLPCNLSLKDSKRVIGGRV